MRAAVMCLLSIAFVAAGCSKKEEVKPAAPTEPLRKPGLWSIEMVELKAGIPGPPTGMQVCIDKETDKFASLVGGGMGPTAACTQTAKRAGEGWTVTRVCRSDERTTTTKGEVTGDLDSEYAVDTVTRTAPPIEGAAAESEHTITGKWLSDCGHDQKPGDVTLSNGVTYNLAKGAPAAP